MTAAVFVVKNTNWRYTLCQIVYIIMVRLVLLYLLYYIPGPPKIVLDGDTFQLYPVIKTLSSEFDPDMDTTFHLYTKDNISNAQTLKIGNDSALTASTINFTNPTVMFLHDFMESYKSNDAIKIKIYHLLLGPYNIILVDNQKLLAGPYYFTSTNNVEPIGNYVAAFVDYLVQRGLDINDLQIIGMGLGSHIAGIVGKKVKSGKIGRITGLDPTGSVYNRRSSDKKLSKGDAQFVDIIHTNAGIFGVKSSSGDLDIWFNGGSFQPGCDPLSSFMRRPISPSELIFCNHYQAWRLYVKALISPSIYLAVKCKNYRNYNRGKCGHNEKTYVGVNVNKTARGNYYIDTGVTAVDV